MNLEVYIRLKDMMSSGLVKMADTARKTTSAIKGTNDTLSQSYDTIKRKISELEGVIGKSTSVKQIREARRELEGLHRLANKSPGNIASSSSRGGLLRSFLPALGIAGAMALGGASLSNGLQAQARQASFEVIAGKEGGTRLNKNLTKFAQDSIYGNEVFQGAQTMLGFGIGEKDVMKNTKMLGDIAMGDANKLGSLTLAFSQVSAAGKLTGQDLLQFINAGFNPLQQISKDTGISLGELKKKVEEGAISFNMVEQAFKSATSEGGMFYQMTEKIAETDFGKWQAFQGQLSGLSTQIGGVLAPILGNLITNYLVPLTTWISQNIDLIAGLGVVLASGAAGFYLYTAGVWAVSAAKTVWAVMTGQLTIAQWALNAAMKANPIGLVIAGIAALVAGIVYAWKNFDGFRMFLYGLWESFKQVFTNIGNFFKKIFDPIFEAIDAVKKGDWGKAALATGKLLFNLTPVGMVANAVSFASDGGFTKDVDKAYRQGEWNSKMADIKDKIVLNENKKTSASTGDITASTPLTDVYDSLKNSKGKNSGLSQADESVKGIAGGGPRIINIHINKMVEKIELHSQNITEGLSDVEKQVEETLLRVLNSGANVQ